MSGLAKTLGERYLEQKGFDALFEKLIAGKKIRKVDLGQ